MTDIIRLKQQEAVLRLLFQNAHKDVEKPLHAQKNVVAKRDCLTISSEAMEIQKTAQIYGQSENIKFDQNVDIASYFEAAREANQKTLENAGDEITRSGQKCPYVSSGEVCYQILTDKYSKLIEEAKKHDDPELYIERKYYDPTCPWFTSDLTREERSIGYRNEMSMLKRGKVVGANMLDSVFRINNLTLEYDEINASQISYYRQLCDAQLNFIFSKNKIEVGEVSQHIFRVDPYSYYISVDCEDATIKGKMESVLNQGENGKHLWQQIKWFSEQDGAHGTQISNKLSIHKTWAYREVYRYTGYQLHELKEENGTYYTEDGTDIKTVIREEVWKYGKIQFFRMRQKRIMHRLSVAGFRKWQSGAGKMCRIWCYLSDTHLLVYMIWGRIFLLIMEVSGINNIWIIINIPCWQHIEETLI